MKCLRVNDMKKTLEELIDERISLEKEHEEYKKFQHGLLIRLLFLVFCVGVVFGLVLASIVLV